MEFDIQTRTRTTPQQFDHWKKLLAKRGMPAPAAGSHRN
jgi:hypothetical protein